MSDKECLAEMPKYNSHKQVWALQIENVDIPKNFLDCDSENKIILSWVNKNYASKFVDADWYRRHLPRSGDYYVVYDNGYASVSPKEAFENGYTLAPI